MYNWKWVKAMESDYPVFLTKFLQIICEKI